MVDRPVPILWEKMVSVHFSIVLRGRPRRCGTSSSPNREAVCSTQAANLRPSESEGKRKKELTPFFHQAIGVQPKGIPFFGLGQRVKELLEVRVVEEDAAAIIAPIEGVVNQTVGDRSRLSSHAANLRLSESEGKRKKRTDTIFFSDVPIPATASGQASLTYEQRLASTLRLSH